MDIQQLRYFKQAVDDGSLSKTAAHFFMTPQAMRKQINHLENEVGVPIFLRTPQGVAPSDAGRVLYDYARRLIALSDEALSACRQKAGAEQQRVRIGLYRNANLHLMPRLVTRFAEEHPDIELSFTDFVIYEEIEKALTDGVIDVVMTFGNEQRRKEGVVNLVLEHEASICSVPHDSELASRTGLTLADLRGRAIVFPTRGSCLWLDTVRRYVESNEPEITIAESPSNEQGVMLLKQRNTVGVGIPIVVGPDNDGRAIVPFAPPPGVDDRVSVELTTNQPDSPAVQALYRCARDICANELQFGC